MSTALSGCVITEETATRLKYKKKCDKCGHLLPGETVGVPVRKHTKKNSSFVCLKCKARNKLVIQG